MARHALPRPLNLTNPAPVKGAARFGADHVHAAAVPLRRGPAPRARFTDHPDRNRARVSAHPAGPGGPGVGGQEGGEGGGAGLGVGPAAGEAGPQVSSLQTIPTKDEPALETGHSSASFC